MHEMDAIKQHLEKNAKVVFWGVGALLVSGVFLTIVSNSSIDDPLYTYDASYALRHGGARLSQNTGVLGVQTQTAQYNLNVDRTTETSTDIGLAAGEKHVAVHLTITNTSSQVMQISPLLQMLLVNDKGGLYRLNAAFAGKDALGGPLQAGATSSGTIDFSVPAQATVKQLLYQPDSNTPKAYFDLR